MCLCVFKCRGVVCVRACEETEHICTLGLANCQTAKTEEWLNRRQKKKEREDSRRDKRQMREKKQNLFLVFSQPLENTPWNLLFHRKWQSGRHELIPWWRSGSLCRRFLLLRICLPRYWIIYSLPAFLIQPSIPIHSAHVRPSTGPECSLEVYNGIDLVVCLLKWLLCAGEMIISPAMLISG